MVLGRQYPVEEEPLRFLAAVRLIYLRFRNFHHHAALVQVVSVLFVLVAAPTQVLNRNLVDL